MNKILGLVTLLLSLNSQVLVQPQNIISWTPVTFSAGDYTATAGTWTVSSGNVTTMKYAITGKVMILQFDVASTSVSNANAGLKFAIPNGYIANAKLLVPIRITSNAVPAFGLAQITAAGQTVINFLSDAAGDGFAISASNAGVQGEITFEIQ